VFFLILKAKYRIRKAPCPDGPLQRLCDKPKEFVIEIGLQGGFDFKARHGNLFPYFFGRSVIRRYLKNLKSDIFTPP
jgi:hypothetical protein